MLMEMHKWAVQPDVISCNAALSAFEQGVRWEVALEFLEKMARR